MRISLLLVAVSAAGPVLAQAPQPMSAVIPASAPAATAVVTDPLVLANERIAQLEKQISAANAENQRLRLANAAEVRDRTAAEELCVGKNIRLIRLGREFLAAYDKKYRKRHSDPLQPGRRAFEAESQEYDGRIYENKYDVPLPQQNSAPLKPLPGNEGAPASSEAKNQ